MAEANEGVVYLPILPVAREHLVGNSVLAALATIVVALRLYGRHFSIGYGWDDGLIVFAWIISMSLVIETAFLGRLGNGYDLFPDSVYFPTRKLNSLFTVKKTLTISLVLVMQNFPTYMQIILSFQLLYTLALTFVKCSILMFYRRIFVSGKMQKLTWLTIGIVVLWWISHSLAMLFICHPVAFWWDLTIEGGYCLDQVPIYVSLIITNIITDLIIMALPMVTIWELNMKTTEKFALTAAFALGIASVGIAIWRLVTVFQVNIAANATGSLELASFLCTLETVLALLCVNIPLLRPLYRRFIVRKSSSRLDESSSRKYAGPVTIGGSGLPQSHSANADLELDSYSKSRGFEHAAYVEETRADGDDDSERKLNPYGDGRIHDIVVKKEWTVNRE
ncbi:Satratoxin biosynthesis SC19 cluster protein [Paramyrothecium foliicola]|nr:Satratoxin biosynthesis SC19 cluster protein [Paramyrothecium foliicola]